MTDRTPKYWQCGARVAVGAGAAIAMAMASAAVTSSAAR
jgi:hypothetical protein